MLLSLLSRIYKNHEKIFIALLTTFVFSHSWRTRIKMVLSAPEGPNEFLKKSCELKKQFNPNTKHFISVVSIMKNEGPYLKEWIEYYRIIGIEKFYLYDNESSDNTKKILEPYIKQGIVEYIYMPGEKMQLPAYEHFLTHYAKETLWAAIIDLDEYIVIKKKTLHKFLDKHKNASQILVPWVFFGSNGHVKKPKGLMIENYTKRAKKQRLYKGIIKPQLTMQILVHRHIVAGKTIFPKMNEIMVNHYYCKSFEEYKKRTTRGDALHGKKFAKQTFNEANFHKFDINDTEDTFILRYVDEIKNRLKRSK